MRSLLRPSALVISTVLLVGILFATAEERLFGAVTDEQVNLATSLAIARFGEVGVPRDAAITMTRDGGDAVAPYGLGVPLAFAPFMAAASRWERIAGSGSSQAVLVILPICLVALASAGAGLLARALGAKPAGQALAVLATGLGSPLWTYASTAFSEPLQAASVVLAVLFAVRRRAFLAGLFAGMAVLAKSVDIVLVPLLLLPLLSDGTGLRERLRLGRRRAVQASLGALLTLGAWLAGDIVRFGRPLRGYAGQHFSHPPLDGLWRLLVGSHEGLLLFFPMLLLALLGLFAIARAPPTRLVALSIMGVLVSLLALYSAWWAWDGSTGWGPRLLMPVVPLLAAAAGVAFTAWTWARTLGACLLVLGMLVNALGVVQADLPTVFWLNSCRNVPLDVEHLAWYPDQFAQVRPGRYPAISRAMAAASDDAFAPIPLHLFLLQLRLSPFTAEERDRELSQPPWLASRPDAVPHPKGRDGQLSGIFMRYLDGDFRWPHWGEVVQTPEADRVNRYFAAWQSALLDQILRSWDLGDPERGLELTQEYWEITRSPLGAAYYAEALRETGRALDLRVFLRGLTSDMRDTPEMDVVLALMARDAGQEPAARAVLALAQPSFDTVAMEQALTAPLRAWPSTYRELTR